MCLKTSVEAPKVRQTQLPEPPVQLRPEKDLEQQLDPKLGADRENDRNRRGVRAMRTDLSLPMSSGPSGLNI